MYYNFNPLVHSCCGLQNPSVAIRHVFWFVLFSELLKVMKIMVRKFTLYETDVLIAKLFCISQDKIGNKFINVVILYVNLILSCYAYLYEVL